MMNHDDMKERLQKLLARAGVASRRAAEEMILAGRVTVNGRIVQEMGSRATAQDDIRVDGKRIVIEQTKRYVVLHKPAGYMTTLSDPEKRRTVKDLIPGIPERLYPVGRLDYESEGLLIMTNDGDFAYCLQHPRFGVPKSYRVEIPGVISPEDLKTLAEGIHLSDGWFKPLHLGLEKTIGNNSWITLTIAEGRNRIIRRALDHLGYTVRRLIRVAIGGVRIGSLKKGAFRDLTSAEMDTLRIFLKKLS